MSDKNFYEKVIETEPGEDGETYLNVTNIKSKINVSFSI